ncbi:MAG TPA: methionyl-tRNA formyltransferase, partial [Planctomycetota bacterium]|nr:methionyl-tRNA formyltransferase [Planctomycetota bacterium]
MKTVFLGTDDFPIPTLHALVAAKRAPDLVVTKADAPRGRGRKIYPQRVRLVAEELGIPCEQPEDVLEPAFLERLRDFAPDLILVVSFGRILNDAFLKIPKQFCLNVHGSLLPKFRGASPIAHAVLAGEELTGVTVQKIALKLDTGPILHRVETKIGKHEHAGELYNRLSKLAGDALVQALEKVEAGDIDFVAQDDAKASRAPKHEKEQGFIDWEKEAVEIDRDPALAQRVLGE